MTNSPESQKAANAKEDGPEKPSRRPRHSFNPELAKLICDRIAEGWSLRKICQDANMPARSSIFGWLEEHEEFARQYTLARQIQIEDLWDEILEIADDKSNDWIEREGPDGRKYREFNSDNFRRCKLRIAAREWLLSKLLPKRYSWDWFLDDNLRDELNLHVKREGGSK
jgi:hypothetical protein